MQHLFPPTVGWCTEPDSEATTVLDLGADMEIHTQPELDTAVAMVVATVGNTVALMEVTIVAAQLVDWLAGLPVGRQALVSEVPRKDEIHNSLSKKKGCNICFRQP